MVDIQALENSKKLYDESRVFFLQQNITECVIEISGNHMSNWIIHFTSSSDDMFRKRAELSRAKKPFIAIYTAPEGKYFFFTDFIVRTLELIDTKKIVFSHIFNSEEINKKKILEEFLELKKMLQNS